MTKWTKDLATAPQLTPQGTVVIAILQGSDVPEAVVWRTYTPDVASAAGVPGYWDYLQENISEITGGIAPHELSGASWTLLTLP